MNKARSIPILLLSAILLSITFTGCQKQSAEETVAAPVATTEESESTPTPEDNGEEPEATEVIETIPTSTVDPTALTAVIVGGDSAGTGKPFAFDATQSQPGATSIVAYEWDMGDGTFLFGLAVEHVYMEAGSYTVTLTITDEEGEQSSTSKVVEVEDLVDDILPTEESELALASMAWEMDNAIRGTTVTLEFSEETVSGSSGCNSYNAKYSTTVVAGPATGIAFTAISSTSKSCTLEIMAQEQGYLESLESAESYTIEDPTLILETGSGTLTFSMMSN